MNLAVQDVIKRPLITEKAERDREALRQYAFEVHREATKIQVKQAVEKLFNVHVRGGPHHHRARQEQAGRPQHRPAPQLEEGHRDPQGGRDHRALRGTA